MPRPTYKRGIITNLSRRTTIDEVDQSSTQLSITGFLVSSSSSASSNNFSGDTASTDGTTIPESVEQSGVVITPTTNAEVGLTDGAGRMTVATLAVMASKIAHAQEIIAGAGHEDELAQKNAIEEAIQHIYGRRDSAPVRAVPYEPPALS